MNIYRHFEGEIKKLMDWAAGWGGGRKQKGRTEDGTEAGAWVIERIVVVHTLAQQIRKLDCKEALHSFQSRLSLSWKLFNFIDCISSALENGRI